jgi:tyrosyl-tRNA synthetase
MDKIDELLSRGVEKIYPSKEALEKVLRSGKKIRLYQGFDPSMPSLHLGNLVGVIKLRQFQELGHEVIFLVGDFTGMIGDPTDKSATRRQLTREEVRKNSQNWKKQVSKILHFDGKNPAKMLYNSQWLSKLSFTEIAALASHITYQQTIERDMFQKRIHDAKDIYLHEFLYPLMQAYDSVHMDVDLEIGGSDQMFNMLVGRDLMHKLKNKEKMVMTLKLLVDKEGNKVGKTTGNALFLSSTPPEMYGGIMSFPDEVIVPAFELLTNVPIETIKELETAKANPMDLKKKLAFEIVKIIYGESKAKKAQEDFGKQFQKKTEPSEIPLTPNALPPGKYPAAKFLHWLIPTCASCASISSTERLIEGGGTVIINGQRINDPHSIIDFKGGETIWVGKRDIFKARAKK